MDDWRNWFIQSSAHPERLITVFAGVSAQPDEQLVDRFGDTLLKFGSVFYPPYTGQGFNGPKTAEITRQVVQDEFPHVTELIALGASVGTLVGADFLTGGQWADGQRLKRGLLGIDPTGGIVSLKGFLNRQLVRCLAAPLSGVSRFAGQMNYVRKVGKTPWRMHQALKPIQVHLIMCPDRKNNGVLRPKHVRAWWHGVARDATRAEAGGKHCDFAGRLDEYVELVHDGLQRLTSVLGAASTRRLREAPHRSLPPPLKLYGTATRLTAGLFLFLPN